MAYIDGKEILFPAKVNVTGTKAEQKKTVDITENGTTKVLPDNGYSLYEVTVNTNVASAKPEQIKTLNITENGTTEAVADEGFALSKVIINTNVAGSGGVDGFHAVRFYNDDRTTLLYTVYVPSGSSAIYAGSTPISTVDNSFIFEGFTPAATNVTSNLDCYAVYAEFASLEDATWEQLSEISAKGTAENFFAVGDTKTIHVEGTIGGTAVNNDYKVFILGFNHNAELEGEGITFGTFKTTDGKDICIIGTTPFKINTSSTNTGGWQACDMRCAILGSVDVAGAQYAGEETAVSPANDTFMSVLPLDLRTVMKPMAIYTNNKGGMITLDEDITLTTDYLPLIAECELCGNNFEGNKQKQYTYYKYGGKKTKYSHSAVTTVKSQWLRTPNIDNSQASYRVYWRTHYGENSDGSRNNANSTGGYGIAPIFRV